MVNEAPLRIKCSWFGLVLRRAQIGSAGKIPIAIALACRIDRSWHSPLFTGPCRDELDTDGGCGRWGYFLKSSALPRPQRQRIQERVTSLIPALGIDIILVANRCASRKSAGC